MAHPNRPPPHPGPGRRLPSHRLDRVDAAQDRGDELERLRAEARYRRERFELYRARMYGGRATSRHELEERRRAAEGAAARLRSAEARDEPDDELAGGGGE
jgi:hypothetical protein